MAGAPTGGQDIEIEIIAERLSDHYLMSPNDLHRGRGPWAGLTPAARCGLAALLTFSSGWKLSRRDVDELLAPLGRDAVSAVLKELRAGRFLVTKRVNAGGGKFKWQWKVSLRPVDVSPAQTIDGLTVDGSAVDGESVDGGEQPKQGVFAGRTIDGLTIDGQPVDKRKNRTTSEEQEDQSLAPPASPSPPTPTRRRGTRIPDDFAATPEMIAWARVHTPLVGARETETFVNYWQSESGAKASKIDWVKTWKVWMAGEQKRAERYQRRQPQPAPPPAVVPADEKCEHRRRRGTCGLCRAAHLGRIPGEDAA